MNDVVYGVSLFDGLVFAATLLLLCFYFFITGRGGMLSDFKLD